MTQPVWRESFLLPHHATGWLNAWMKVLRNNPDERKERTEPLIRFNSAIVRMFSPSAHSRDKQANYPDKQGHTLCASQRRRLEWNAFSSIRSPSLFSIGPLFRSVVAQAFIIHQLPLFESPLNPFFTSCWEGGQRNKNSQYASQVHNFTV